MRRCAQSKLDESHDRRSIEPRPCRAESSGGAEPLGVEDGEACRSLAGLPAVFRPATVEAGSVRGRSSPRLRSDRRGGGGLHALHGHFLALHHFRERLAPFRLIVFTSVLLRVVAHAAFRFRNGRRRRRWVEHTWPKRHRRKCGGETHARCVDAKRRPIRCVSYADGSPPEPFVLEAGVFQDDSLVTLLPSTCGKHLEHFEHSNKEMR